MEVTELWRYPVKSMAGERVKSAELGDRGLPGDRRLAAFEMGPRSTEKPVSARKVAPLLRFRASLSEECVQVAGPALEPGPWDHISVSSSLLRECGREFELRQVAQGAFDDSPVLLVHLATTAALSREMGAPVDHRRFRANIYLDGPGLEAHQEPSLVGCQLRCGTAVLEVTAPCPRCAITTLDPDTVEVWPELLRHLVWQHQEVVGVYCRVRVPGRVAEGDAVEFI
jgi:hypothetical protein